MSNMPKSTLTEDELKLTDYIILLKYDLQLWIKGLQGQTITSQQARTSFYTLGYLVMGPEGFNDLFQGITITSRIQNEIDENFRQFNAQ